MNNIYTRWLDWKIYALFLEYIEVIKAYEIVQQYSQVTERIEDFYNSRNIHTFVCKWVFKVS